MAGIADTLVKMKETMDGMNAALGGMRGDMFLVQLECSLRRVVEDALSEDPIPAKEEIRGRLYATAQALLRSNLNRGVVRGYSITSEKYLTDQEPYLEIIVTTEYGDATLRFRYAHKVRRRLLWRR